MDLQDNGKFGVLITLENSEEIEDLKGIVHHILSRDDTWLYYDMAQEILDFLNQKEV